MLFSPFSLQEVWHADPSTGPWAVSPASEDAGGPWSVPHSDSAPGRHHQDLWRAAALQWHRLLHGTELQRPALPEHLTRSESQHQNQRPWVKHAYLPTYISQYFLPTKTKQLITWTHYRGSLWSPRWQIRPWAARNTVSQLNILLITPCHYSTSELNQVPLCCQYTQSAKTCDEYSTWAILIF